MAYERLTALDRAFLHLEGSTSPMHAGLLATFEAAPFVDEHGRFRLNDVRSEVEARLDRVPRLRQKLQSVPLGQGPPVWVDDGALDIAYHVRVTALPMPGGDEQLRALMARVQAQPLDRRRPLWELWFVEGLESDRIGVIQKTHLAAVDGLSGLDGTPHLLDAERNPRDSGRAPAWAARPAPSALELLRDSVAERIREPADLARSVITALAGVGDRLRAATTTSPRLSFNGPIGPHRRWEMARVDLELAPDVQAVRAAVAGALRTWLVDAGAELDADALDAVAAVSARTDLAERYARKDEAVNLVVAETSHQTPPLFCMGARMLEAFPYVGIVDGLGLSIAAVPYDGQLGFGLTADRDLEPDLGRLADAIEKSFRELGGST